MVTGIYKITNHLGLIYIGQSTDIIRKKLVYEKKRCKSQPKIYSSIINFGWDTHSFEIIKECEINELNKFERYFQELYNSIENGLNSMYTNTNTKSGLLSEEMKEKLRKPKPKGFGLKLSKTLKSLGDKHMSKQSDSREKRRKTQLTKGSDHPLVKPVIQYNLENENVGNFISARDAGRKTKIHSSHIIDVCNGKRKTAGKFIWKYE